MKLYGNLLGKKRTELSQKMERLENGLQKLQSTASQVTEPRASENSPPLAVGMLLHTLRLHCHQGGGLEGQAGSAGSGAVAEK